MTKYRSRWQEIELVEVERETESCVWINGRKSSLYIQTAWVIFRGQRNAQLTKYMTINSSTLVTEARNEYVRVNDLSRPGETELRRLWQVMEETERMEWFSRDGWNAETLTFGELNDLRGDLFGAVEDEDEE